MRRLYGWMILLLVPTLLPSKPIWPASSFNPPPEETVNSNNRYALLLLARELAVNPSAAAPAPTAAMMAISVDGQLRHEIEADLSQINEPLEIFSYDSTIKIKSARVRQLAQ